MTRHRLAAGLYAPLRVFLYEDEKGNAVFEYDQPSSLFGQFDDEQVSVVARGLDAALEHALRQAAEWADLLTLGMKSLSGTSPEQANTDLPAFTAGSFPA